MAGRYDWIKNISVWAENNKGSIAKFIARSAGLNIVSMIFLPLVILFSVSLFSDGSVPDENIERVQIPEYINVYITSSGRVDQIKFEEYVKGVVASEMPSSFEFEALKAQAVAARTYSLSKIIRSGDSGFPDAHPNAPLCDDVHCQAYRSEAALRSIKGDAWMEDGYKKVCRAVDETSGEVMYYDGTLVAQALFHSSSGGKTENSEDVFASAVPYLRSVSSPYEEGATHYGEQKSFSLIETASLLNSKYTDRYTGNFRARDIEIRERTTGGRVERIVIGNAAYSGREIREALGLASANFDVQASGDYVTFTTVGYGHGVGMSQYGANGMAKEGFDYKEILEHYYTGVKVL